MFFVSLLFTAMIVWFLPWWALPVLAFLAGFLTRTDLRRSLEFAAAAGVSWSALAFYRDGQSFGQISPRLAAAFQLPSSAMFFLVVAAIGAVTGFLWFEAGRRLRAP